MTLHHTLGDTELYERSNMFHIAVKAAGRFGFDLAFGVGNMDWETREPQGWVREQLEEIRLAWTAEPDSFPAVYFNEGIPDNEVWPVVNEKPVSWRVAVNSTTGLGRLRKLYVGGKAV